MLKDNAFIKAILFKEIATVKQYIVEGIDLDFIDEYGLTPLIEATIAQHQEIVILLLTSGASVNQRDTTGRTALHWAVDNADLFISTTLLKYGADPNAYTVAGQSVLVFPYLRQQNSLKKLLQQYQGRLSFAQDFIQVKLLGHRYQLIGQADIIAPDKKFLAIDYEGFFLEFVVDIIRYSLMRYIRHFTSRQFVQHFAKLNIIIDLFQKASQLLQYQKYTIHIQKFDKDIDALLDNELVLLPLAYEGHAISLIRYHNLLILCDRGVSSHPKGGITIYRMHHSRQWTNDFIKDMLYVKKSRIFFEQKLHYILGLESIGSLFIEKQQIGNCSWANMEASVLALLYLLLANEKISFGCQPILQRNQVFQAIYEHWLAWDKTRALEDCLQNFAYASSGRKATIATLLGAVLFQTYDYRCEKDTIRAQKLIQILTVPQYQYILKSYLKIYWKDRKTPEGHNLVQLLNIYGVTF